MSVSQSISVMNMDGFSCTLLDENPSGNLPELGWKI
jgi:hypothetical protein